MAANRYVSHFACLGCSLWSHIVFPPVPPVPVACSGDAPPSGATRPARGSLCVPPSVREAPGRGRPGGLGSVRPHRPRTFPTRTVPQSRYAPPAAPSPTQKLGRAIGQRRLSAFRLSQLLFPCFYSAFPRCFGFLAACGRPNIAQLFYPITYGVPGFIS